VGNQSILSDLGEVEDMDAVIEKSLRQHAKAAQAEIEQAREAEALAAQERAGHKHLEEAQQRRFMQQFGFFLEMSRYASSIQEERKALERQMEMEANEREYYRELGIQHDDWSLDTMRDPLQRGMDALRAKLTGGW
jgi:hypothetical protein